MLMHTFAEATPPDRVVILGANGFVAAATAAWLIARNVPVIGLGRDRLDLESEDAAARLADILQPQDTLLFVAARAPVKTVAMLNQNLRMAQAVAEALAVKSPAHVVYVSSDAVYRDSAAPLSEQSCAQPGALHGVMHLARETVLSHVYTGPLAFMRPTLIYGRHDPHNGYGPNRFARLAAAGEDIVLFGEGEERRDHVAVENVAELTGRTILHRSRGVLNIATGETTSFRAIAETVVALAGKDVAIKGAVRNGPMPHNGYRPFDPKATFAAFPDFRYTPIKEGLSRLVEGGRS